MLRTTPVTIITVSMAMKAYTGTANIRPASFMPRKLAKEISSNAATVISKWYGPSRGTSDTTANVPDAHCTATVTT